MDIEKIIISRFIQVKKIKKKKKIRNTLLVTNKDDNYKIKPLCIMLPKTSEYIKIYDDKTWCIYFLIEDDKLLKEYNKTFNKDNNSIKKVFHSKPV